MFLLQARIANVPSFMALALVVGCGGSGSSNIPNDGSSGGRLDAAGGTSVSGGATSGGTTNPVGGNSSGTSSSGAGAGAGGTATATGGASPLAGRGGQTGGNSSGGSTGSGGRNVAGSGVGAGGTGGAMTSAGQGGVAPQAGAGNDVIITITNGGFWQDTAGNRIEAHGAGLIRVGDAWYWIGEDKSANSGNFKAVNCYRSTDLSHWEFRHAIITRQTSTDLAASDRIIERPKVVYNETSKKYVMWLHWEGQNYATAEAGVFTSDTVDGDYTQVRHFRPNKNMSRDDTLFKDEDGKAYFLSASNENADLSLYELTDDYTDMKRQISTLWAGSYREAPAIMKVDGRYFIVNSGATGWDPNQQKYASATSLEGPWSALSNLGDSTAFDTQTAYIIPVQGSKATTYIYAGDRWQDPDLKGSKYIWLPIRVSGTKLILDFYEKWQLNVTTGQWSGGAQQDDGFIPQTNWSLVSVDSEETQGEDGAAVNAFDNSTSTFWHTEWQDAQPAHPHEIVIDLGATYSLTSMRYTPRQDKDENGMVANYEFYVSESSSDWGAVVKTGTFGTSRSPTTVTFPAKTARYIRFRGLSEINGKAYTSVAELDVAGTAL